jgi:hypothetical protein
MTIKRVAKAIYESILDENDERPDIDFQFQARAALAAIEEPTEAMIEAALKEDPVAGFRGIWRAMHKAMMEQSE